LRARALTLGLTSSRPDLTRWLWTCAEGRILDGSEHDGTIAVSVLPAVAPCGRLTAFGNPDDGSGEETVKKQIAVGVALPFVATPPSPGRGEGVQTSWSGTPEFPFGSTISWQHREREAERREADMCSVVAGFSNTCSLFGLGKA
jgi:hypothetical protein